MVPLMLDGVELEDGGGEGRGKAVKLDADYLENGLLWMGDDEKNG